MQFQELAAVLLVVVGSYHIPTVNRLLLLLQLISS
jgi:hypothetical protein